MMDTDYIYESTADIVVPAHHVRLLETSIEHLSVDIGLHGYHRLMIRNIEPE
jgi:hypothetical protein